MRLKITPETRDDLHAGGWHVLSAHQAVQQDGRKLARCAQPSDPWVVTLIDHRNPLVARRQAVGRGETVEIAIRAALGERSRLEIEIDKLIAVFARLG